MIQNNAAIGVTFSGEASQMLEKNPNLKYVVPTEASNLWFDNMVIPKPWKTKMPPMLYQLYVETRKCSEKCGYVGYSTPNLPAKEMLPEETREDKSFYPDADTIETPRSL